MINIFGKILNRFFQSLVYLRFMILVTGGTGLVGAHLLYHLLQKHQTVRATHRSSSNLDSVKEVFSFYTADAEALFATIEWVEANITEIPLLTKAFEGITHVYHCAAFISFDPKHFKALQKANIEGTANIVNLCLDFNIKKLCYVSSIATIGHPLDHELANESDPWNPEEEHSVYSITKYGAEMEVWRATQEGLNAVIVNPGVIIGSGYWNSSSGTIVKRASKGVPFYTQGSTGFVDVQDVVTIMMELMQSTISNQGFILVGENVSFQELLSKFNHAFGHKAPNWSCPSQLLYLLSMLDAISSKLFGTKRFLLPATVRSMFSTSKYDSAKIKTALGYSFTPLEETIKRVAGHYPH